MGFVEGLTWYWWNWTVFVRSILPIFYSEYAGGVGLFFDDDDGYMQGDLLELQGGSYNTTFPVKYKSAYVDPAEYDEATG